MKTSNLAILHQYAGNIERWSG